MRADRDIYLGCLVILPSTTSSPDPHQHRLPIKSLANPAQSRNLVPPSVLIPHLLAVTGIGMTAKGKGKSREEGSGEEAGGEFDQWLRAIDECEADGE